MGVPRNDLVENAPNEIKGKDERGNLIVGDPLKPNILVMTKDGKTYEGIFVAWCAQLIEVEIDRDNHFSDFETRRFATINVRYQRDTGPESGQHFWNEQVAFWEDDLISQWGKNSPNVAKKTRFQPMEGWELPPAPKLLAFRGSYGTPEQAAARQQLLKEIEPFISAKDRAAMKAQGEDIERKQNQIVGHKLANLGRSI